MSSIAQNQQPILSSSSSDALDQNDYPICDIYETPMSYTIKLEVPDLQISELYVSQNKNIVNVESHRYVHCNNLLAQQSFKRENPDFQKEFRLSQNCINGSLQSKLINGILTINVQKIST